MVRRFAGSLILLSLLAPRGLLAAEAPAPVPAPAAPVVAPPSEAPGAAPPEAAPAKAEDAVPAAPADAPDDPAVATEVDAAARELEELRAAEEATLDGGGKRAAELYRAMQRLGAGGPLHQRLQDALSPERGVPVVPDAAEVEAAALAEVGSFDIEKAKLEYDIPVEMHPLVAEYIRFFQTNGRKHFVKWIGRSYRYLPMMRKKLREEGLPEDTVYLSMIESGFSNLAYSRAKAAGPWQFIQPTGVRYGLQVDFWVDERRDPVRATGAAAQYLKELYQEFGDWRLAWSGYNAGENKVRKTIKLENTRDFWVMVTGKSLRKETKHYVPKLMAAALLSKHLKQFGFDDAEFQADAALNYDEVEIPEATDLEVIARSANVTVDALTDLNPELRRWCTPPPRRKGDVYRMKLPAGTATLFAENFARIPAQERLSFQAHKVERGETLSRIAAQHGSAPEAIMRMNGLRDSKKLKLGTELVIPVPRSGGGKLLAAQSRARGFIAAPPDQEIPAAAPQARASGKGAAGVVKTVKENGKTKVTYGVVSGDSLWTIAQQFGVTVEQMKGWNDLEGRRVVLKLGQELTIYPNETKGAVKVARAPETAHQAVSAKGLGGKPIVLTVARGDTLGSVALRYGVSVEDIKRWNNLEKARDVKAGQQLTLHVP